MNASTEEDKLAADDTDIEVENASESGIFIKIGEDKNHPKNGESQNGENNNNSQQQQQQSLIVVDPIKFDDRHKENEQLLAIDELKFHEEVSQEEIVNISRTTDEQEEYLK